ncbi:MAG: ATP-binding cassette domain-containing protein [Microthrixaceae bacterium]|nr:ATP-binding cassette domain-containing protein [Microthrixaceae bacterium]
MARRRPERAEVMRPGELLDRYGALPKWARALSTVGILVAVWAIAAALLPRGAPKEIVLQGVILGSAQALTAFGIILIWRANRIINFSVAAMGGLGGGIGVHLFRDWNWPYAVTIPIGVVMGLLVGLAVEVAIIRRFSKASRLVVMVATLGLTQLLGGIDIIIGTEVFGNGSLFSGAFDTPLSKHTKNVGFVLFNGNHLLIAVVAPLVAAALGWFLRKSLAGQGIRAAAENSERARLVGIPVRRLQSLVWLIAGGLSALTLCLSAPVSGMINSAATGPTLLLPALAAAVVAKMESLPIAFGAALTLGAIDQVAYWNSDSPDLTNVAFLAIILAALLFQRSSKSRAFDAESSWQDNGSTRPIPAVMMRLPEVRGAIFLGGALLLAATVLVPQWVSDGTTTSLTIMVIWGMVAISLVVLTGWSGQISLGQFAFVGVGAMVTGNLVMRADLDLFLALGLASIAGGLVAVIQGVPALRISGPFLGVVTLAFAVVFDGYLLNPNHFPDLIPGTVDAPVLFDRWSLENAATLFYVCAGLLVLVVLAARGVRRARSGRLLIATRDNRKAAEAMSVWSRRQTLTGFLFAGMVAGLAGGLHVIVLRGARLGSYPPLQSIEVFSMATIGGLGSLGGALVGAFGIRGLNDWVPSNIRLVLNGTGMLLILWLLPGGIGPLMGYVREWTLRRVAARRGMHVPGLTDLHAVEPLPAAPTSAASAAGGNGAVPLPGVGVGPDQAPRPLIECRNIDVSYGQLQVLFGVDFAVQQGEIVALLGTNGAGKSTLLRALVGLTNSKGTRRVGDVDLTKRSVEQVCTHGVALMPGGRSIFPTLTVTENLKLATWTFRHDSERIRSDTEAVLDLFPVLKTRLDQMAGNLSGGEQQQLALAQTLLLRPRVLLIDELSLGLAPSIVGQLIEVVKAVWRNGATIVIVEQSVNVALSLAERAVFLEKGTVRFEGPTRELLDRPDILRSVFIHGAESQEASDTRNMVAAGSAPGGNGASGNGAANPFAQVSLGTPTVDLRHQVSGVVLECRGVVKRFGGIRAVDGAELSVNAGEIVGLIGQNGAGKTTLLDCISGFHGIDGGVIRFRDRDITSWAPFERASAGLGRSFQEARLFPSLTVAETVAVARERHVASRSMMADALRQPASFESELDTARRVRELLGLLSLKDHAEKRTSELSTGMRRIVELACLLAEDPTVLLLDEPSAGVAQKETEALGPLLRRIRDHTGAALVIIEHDMPLLSGVCDTMVALELGAVIASGTPEEVLANDRVIASYLGTDEVAINRSGSLT